MLIYMNRRLKLLNHLASEFLPLLESTNIKTRHVEKHFTPNIPAWCVKQPGILFDLHSGKKSESNPQILKDDFRKLQSRFKNSQHPGATLPPCRGLWGTLHIGDDIDCNTCPLWECQE